jgi:hypothetical protein
MNTKPMNRRDFLIKSGFVSLAACGFIVSVGGCGGNGDNEATSKVGQKSQAKTADDPCGDLTTLTAEEKTTRKTFKYEEVAKDPTKHCDVCNFWQASTTDSPCGTCTLVKGPIDPKGSCISWVAPPPKTTG